APHLSRGRCLDLRFRHLRETWLIPLLGSLYLERLTSLDLTSTDIGNARATMLAASPRLIGLAALHLVVNKLSIAGLSSLVRSCDFANVATLDLGGSPLWHSWVQTLGGSSFPSLRDLNVSGTGVWDTDVQELAASPCLAGLEKLDLRFNEISNIGVHALSAAPAGGNLRVLKLGYNPIGTSGVQALASSPRMAQLPTLNLRRCRVANPAAKALIESPFLGRLHRLDLQDNDISQRLCEALRERFGEAVHLS